MVFVRKLKKLDMFMLLLVLGLTLIGTMAIYEATKGTKLDGLHWTNVKLFGVFLVPMLLAATIDYRIFISKIAYFLYGIGIVLLLLVHQFGENINGATRWLSIGSFQLQPSELAKIFTVMLAAYLLHRRAGERLRVIHDIVPVCLVFAVPILLIMKQPDLGTALVFVGVMLGMLWLGNVRAIYMAICIGAVVAAVTTVYWLYHNNFELLTTLVADHQISRIQTFIDPASDPDKSWHVNNAIIAIGSGGLSGDTALFFQKGFIPYVYSDSIFVAIGEKYGFLGSAVLLMLYFLLIYRMAIIVKDSRDLAGSFLVVGIMGMLVFQIFVNIGMHIGLVPLTGISLPFISYGGSTMLTNMIAVGLALSVHVHKDEYAVEL